MESSLLAQYMTETESRNDLIRSLSLISKKLLVEPKK
jgi:hypothetical protein